MLQYGLPIWPSDVSLASAVILASNTPLLLLSADMTVLAASRSFCLSFGIAPARATLVPLSHLGQGEWDVPQLTALLLASASGCLVVKDYEMDLRRDGQPVQHLLINAQQLDHSDDRGAMVLLSIVDVTEARRLERQKDILLQEKAVQLDELQHRIANSLQIVASVLLQSARTAPSEEARSRISEAHHRVMSVAALQHQLALSHLEKVDLGPYLTALCRSISASMIHDPAKLAIEVDVGHKFIEANVSLGLGLIVTELVINALKHAFPDHRAGTIVVGYTSGTDGWTLTVRDDGIGMPASAGAVRTGLGSSIVTALTAQLGAVLVVATASPGTRVSISHKATDAATARPEMLAV